MRIRVLQHPTQTSIDGIRLDCFQPGCQYEVGTLLGALMLAEQWAEPVALDDALLVPFSDTDPDTHQPAREKDAPPNLVREHYPRYLDAEPATAADLPMRRRPRC